MNILDIIGVGSIVGAILLIVAKFLPNHKLYALGYKLGVMTNDFGSSKLGSATWEKLEDFLVNSIGEILRGFKEGLDPEENAAPKIEESKFKNVRK